MNDADLFEQALAIPDAAERAAFLARVCAGDAVRRENLERLLAYHDSGAVWPDRTLPDALGLVTDTSGDEGGVPADLAIDGIELLRLIGEGGFGRVYEGWQQRTRRRVAVKVLRTERLDPGAVARFFRETRLAARLSHPGIAAVHAVGTAQTHWGTVPYLVTELVPDAGRLTDHAAGLDLAGRVSLLEDVCRAVAHAHSRGVVHRDLKPGNILVGSNGKPKVIDFGWARSAPGEFTQATLLTQPGQIAGTWQYMSPEQFDAERDSVDTRADVYALGLIAYQIFAGRLPYDVRGRPLPGIANLVRTVPVPALASVDGTIPLPLSRIVAKCMEKQPSQRYADANALADDLGRHAAGARVLARGPTFWQSLALVAHRHPMGVAGLAGLFLGLVVAVIGISRAAILTRDARVAERTALEEAERGRDEARAERETALYHLYTGALLRIGEAATLGETTNARVLIDTTLDLANELGIRETDQASRPLELRCVEAAIDRALAVKFAHRLGVRDMACSPDGRFVATCGREPAWRLWDGSTGALIAEAPAESLNVRRIRFSPTGAVFATVDASGGVQLRNPSTGAIEVILPEMVRAGAGIVFSPDGTRLLTAGDDRDCRIWSVADGSPVGILSGHTGHVIGMAWSPDGTTIATASSDTSYRLWNAANGALVSKRRSHASRVVAMGFSPDSTLLATGDQDGLVHVWPYRTRGGDIVLQGHAGAIRCLGFSPDGTILASGSMDRTIRLWTVADGSPRGKPGLHDAEVHAVAFSLDSALVIAGAANGILACWDSTRCSPKGHLLGHSQAITAIGITANGARVVTASADGEMRLWRGDDPSLQDILATTDEPVDFLQFDTDSRRLALGTRAGTLARIDVLDDAEPQSISAPSGRWATHAASANLAWMATGSRRGSILFWNASRGIDRLVTRAHAGGITALTFAADGTRLVSGDDDGAARLWDPEKAEPLAELGGHTGRVTCVATSPDGRLAATGSEDGTARVWNIADGALVAVCESHGGPVGAVAFGAESTILAVAADDGVVTIHDTRMGDSLERLSAELGRVRSVVFSPDGRWLATTHRIPTTVLWDTTDWIRVAMLPGHNVQTGPAVFSPGGTRLALGGTDGMVRLWDHVRASVLFAAKSHPLTVLATVMSPDGRLVASAGADGVVRIHGRSQRELFDRWKTRYPPGRNLPVPARIGGTSEHGVSRTFIP